MTKRGTCIYIEILMFQHKYENYNEIVMKF